MQGLTDETVMISYQKGEVLAMDEILKRYKNPIFHFAYRFLGSVEQAQEIAQEVFLRIHKQKDRYRPIGKFSTWIFSIAHNLCISLIRKQRRFVLWPRKKDNPDAYVEFPSPDLSQEQKLEQKDLQKAIELCMQELPFLQKEALVLREYHKFSYEEIAATINKPVNTVKSLVRRARMSLKEKLLPIVSEVERGQKC